jgi:CRP-like cAMP-binding protein
VVSIASATHAVLTRGSEAIVWAALAHARGTTARMMAAALGKRALPVRERVRSDLLDLAARFGRDTAHGRRIELPLTQDHLAELVGSTRETVNRAFRTLPREACIEGRRYVVRMEPGSEPADGRA